MFPTLSARRAHETAFDDFSVADNGTASPTPPSSGPAPVAGPIDAATSTMEGSIGHWQPWFSASAAASTAFAHSGTGSLKVGITAPYGWGVQLNNDPGFATTAGPKDVSFWGLAPASTGLGANLTVNWRNASGATIQSNVVSTPALGSTWAKGQASLTAPAGTAFVNVSISSSTGVSGDVAYFDDVVVADAAPPAATGPGAVDADTAGLEGSIGRWSSWFSANASRSSAQAHTGSQSLQVDVTAQWGWGAQVNNFPGFATTAGPKTVSFWGMTRSGSGLAATLTVTWRNGSGQNLRSDTVDLPLGAAWTQASAALTAPDGTASVGLTLSNRAGGPGDSMAFDDFSVADGGTAAPAPPTSPPPAAAGPIDANTSTLEGSLGHWSSWFSATATRSTAQAHSGGASLAVTVTAPYGWGANLNNDPGFATTAGPKTVSFWGMSPNTGLAATLTVNWRSSTGANLRSDAVTLPLGATWAQASASLTAPAGTAFVSVSLSNSAGVAGNTMYFDDIVVAAA